MLLWGAMVTGSSIQTNLFVGVDSHSMIYTFCDSNNYHLGWKVRSVNFVSQTVQAYEHTKKHNIDLPYGQIISMTFVPDSNGCICIGQAGDGTMTCLWRGDSVPPSLARFLGDVPQTNPVQCVLVGSDSGWDVILQNRDIYSNGISDNLKQKLQSATGVLVCFTFFQ